MAITFNSVSCNYFNVNFILIYFCDQLYLTSINNTPIKIKINCIIAYTEYLSQLKCFNLAQDQWFRF